MISRKYRNRRIGEFLKEPKFETNETRDYFITTIFMHDGFENEILNKIKISDKILNYLNQNEYITTTIVSELLGLSVQRTRAILGKMLKEEKIIAEGANRNRKYKLKTKKDTYYDMITRVRTHDDMIAWIKFFLVVGVINAFQEKQIWFHKRSRYVYFYNYQKKSYNILKKLINGGSG